MKKLKIRGKELRKIGYSNNQAVSLAVSLVSKHFGREEKLVALAQLEEVLNDPVKFANDEAFSELASLLIAKKDNKPIPNPKQKFRFKETSEEFEIYGAENIDPEALHQMYLAMKMPVAVRGALMADAHVGYGLPIGGVLAAYNAVMPYAVGMDIGCRMCMTVYPESPKILKGQKDRLKNILIENTRFGLAEFNDIGNHEIMERNEFKEISFLKPLQKSVYRQLGTSGHGNHFVDMGYVVVNEKTDDLNLEPGEYFAILSHSGSRSLGNQIAKHYTHIAQKKLGITGEAANLAWLDLDSEEGQEYWLAMTLAGDYARANHHIIHNKFSKALGEKPLRMIENHHNFAWKEKLSDSETLIIHRKGATPAKIGDLGIIPGNMVAPAFIVSGRGSEKSLNSASHGAGRMLSRRKAKQTFTPSSLRKILKKEDVELIGGAVDESPMAYKNIRQVMEAQKDLVNILAEFYPKIVRME